MNSTSSIDALLAVADSDAGQAETWSVAMPPAHGALSGFSASASSTGGVVIPSGLTYSPATGYTGIDSFMIDVSDGVLSGTTLVIVSVNTPPVLTSALTAPAICDQSVFSYVPTGSVPGATFSWHRATVGGLSNPAASGTGNPNETLLNVTNSDVTATYMYTISAGGCTNSENVTVTVHPSPRLSSPLYDTTCSGAVFNYIPVTTIPGTTFTWMRGAVAGVSPASSSGSGDINETLTDSMLTTVSVNYAFSLSANGCSSVRNLHVLVVPMPPLVSITTAPPSSACAGTLYQNFGASVPPPAGITYRWEALNADIFAIGAGHQYALVNFPNAGNTSVSLIINGGNVRCNSVSTYSVTVGSAEPAGAPLLYYNYQFIYEDNTADTYQWGFDNANTLDSTVIPGATFQSYPNSAPDFLNNYYWVITAKNGCIQKTYFNAPLAVAANAADKAALKLYPNPAENIVHVSVSGVGNENAVIVVTDIAGQTLATKKCNAGTAQFDVSALAAGYYLVACMKDGLRIATTRFIKN